VAADGPTEVLDRVWSDGVDPLLAAPLLDWLALNWGR
jgi:hypothetical protein